MSKATTRRFGDETRWSTTPSAMVVRIGDPMVHRVFQLLSSNVIGHEVILECGVRASRSLAEETEDPVDCMACMIRKTTMEIEMDAEAEVP